MSIVSAIGLTILPVSGIAAEIISMHDIAKSSPAQDFQVPDVGDGETLRYSIRPEPVEGYPLRDVLPIDQALLIQFSSEFVGQQYVDLLVVNAARNSEKDWTVTKRRHKEISSAAFEALKASLFEAGLAKTQARAIPACSPLPNEMIEYQANDSGDDISLIRRSHSCLGLDHDLGGLIREATEKLLEEPIGFPSIP